MFINSTIKSLLVLGVALAATDAAFGQTQIKDQAGLAAMALDPAGNYELAADITLSGTWIPVGTETAPFTGTFDGKGHTIKGLYVTQAKWAGLFGSASGAKISNVNIVDAYVGAVGTDNPGDHTGIVAGRLCNGGVIENVMTSGYVTGFDHVGGIVGDAGEGVATISNCMTTANVHSTQYQAGGIAGWTKGTVTISNNLVLGTVHVGAWGGCGGIVGFIEDGTTTVTGNVCAAVSITGNIGKQPVTYADRYTHGIVGCCFNENSSLVSSDNLVSELTAIYDFRTGAEADVTDFSENYHGITTSVADLQKASTYTTLGWDSSVWNLADGRYPVLKSMSMPFDGDYIYTVEPQDVYYVGNIVNTKAVSSIGRTVTITSSNPAVATVDGINVTVVGAGETTITFTTTGDSYIAGATKELKMSAVAISNEIATAADLENMRKNPNGSFKFTADIDMTGVEFMPIANFGGSIDGQGHYIRNFRFEDKDVNDVALIGNFSGTFIKNLGFDNAYLVGNANVAAVVGKTTSDGVISGIAVVNSYIQGRDHVASFVGNIDGNATITNCVSNAVLETREFQCGAFGGVINYGLVDKCIFTGTMAKIGGGEGTNIGFVSLLDSDQNPSTIQNCLVAAAYINGAKNTENVIGLAGRSMTLQNNYMADFVLRNGVKVSCMDADSEMAGPANKVNIHSKDWFTTILGLDFDNDWQFFAGAEGHMIPMLKWMKAPVGTQFFNLPAEIGYSLPYAQGSEFYDSSVIKGSWTEDIAISQLSGEDYACFDTDNPSLIYAGGSDFMYHGRGTAEFKVSTAPALAQVLTVPGRDTFKINVYRETETAEISNTEQFLAMEAAPSLNYELVADIDFGGAEIAGMFNNGTAFTGSINGNGYSVKNFSIKFKEGENKGLFGQIANARIEKISFVDFDIDGGTEVKHIGLIGAGSGTLDQVAVVGSVTGNDHVALVAGDADGIRISNSYAVGKVVGGSQVGGFFGVTLEGGAEITNCFTNVEAHATARGWIGGFIGLLDKSNSTVTINNSVSVGSCYFDGAESDAHVTAPFIAGNSHTDTPNATVFFKKNMYSLDAVMNSDQTWPNVNPTADGGEIETAGGYGAEALQQQAPYSAIDWNFSEIWSMGTGAYKYPVLAAVPVPDEALTKDYSGIEDVTVDSNVAEVEVSAAGNVLSVRGLVAPAAVTVYNLAGMAVAAATTDSAEVTLGLPATGMYVVTVVSGGEIRSFKVVNK